MGTSIRLGRAAWICTNLHPFVRRIVRFLGTKDRDNVCATFLNGERITFKILWGSWRRVPWLPEIRVSPSSSDVWWSNHSMSCRASGVVHVGYPGTRDSTRSTDHANQYTHRHYSIVFREGAVQGCRRAHCRPFRSPKQWRMHSHATVVEAPDGLGEELRAAAADRILARYLI